MHSIGKRQMFPRPTQYPTTVNRNSHDDAHRCRFALVTSSSLSELLTSYFSEEGIFAHRSGIELDPVCRPTPLNLSSVRCLLLLFSLPTSAYVIQGVMKPQYDVASEWKFPFVAFWIAEELRDE